MPKSNFRMYFWVSAVMHELRSEPRVWHPPRDRPAQPPHHVYMLLNVCHCRHPPGETFYKCLTRRLRPKGVPFLGFWWAPIRAKQLSMAVTAGVIWLWACIRLWPYGFGTCASVLILILLLVYGINIRVGISLVEADEREGQICHFGLQRIKSGNRRILWMWMRST